MQNKYCLPILKSEQTKIFELIESNKAKYAFFEVWVDYIINLEITFLSQLTDQYPGRIILVFRRQNLEPVEMLLTRRFKILDSLLGKDCLVDLDITCQKEDLDYTADKPLKKIVSYHNYEKTPADNELNEIVSTIESYQPFILKISTFCNEASDALRLIGIKKDFIVSQKKHIVLGMGQHGEVTRVFGALWDNELIFIPETTNEASAPGQISREDFDKIMERTKK